ncbi:MAG: hypothetical protein KAR42_15090 [candidate division Zixibacteria bacterium]|nr:hypothetical protein [candidate division Zixibacteria bacterium]
MTVISWEVANEQFNLFLDYYDLEAEDFANEATKEQFETASNKLVKAITKGRLEIKEEESLCVTQILKNGEHIEYGVVSGKHKLAMKGKKDTDIFGRIYAIMGSITGLGETAILKLAGIDLSIAESLGFLLLQV